MSWIEESIKDAEESVARLPPGLVDAIRRSGTVATLRARREFEERRNGSN